MRRALSCLFLFATWAKALKVVSSAGVAAEEVYGMAFDGNSWRINPMKSPSLPGVNLVARPRPNPSENKRWEETASCKVPPPEGYMFHSQFAEDIDLYNHYFCGKIGGTYVELGALDGEWLSNTKFFDDSLRWRGALIEATPGSVKRLKRNRRNPGNRIFAEGVCPEGQATMEFMVGKKPEVNGNPTDMADDFASTYWEGGSKKIEVPCRPLGAILKEFLHHANATHIDFFSLDVEGGEFSVLHTFDFDVPVNVWIIEMDGLNPDKDEQVRQLLQAKGYVKSDKAFEKKNEVWVHKSCRVQKTGALECGS